MRTHRSVIQQFRRTVTVCSRSVANFEQTAREAIRENVCSDFLDKSFDQLNAQFGVGI